MWLYVLLAVLTFFVWNALKPAKEKNGGSIEEFFSVRASSFYVGRFSTAARQSGVAVERKKEVDRYAFNYATAGKAILVAYGTEYGFSEQLAKKLIDAIVVAGKERGIAYQPRLLNLRDHESVQWAQEQCVIFVCSTTGDGVPPAETKGFMDVVLGGTQAWSHLSFAVLALGDSTYTHYCRTGINLDQRCRFAPPPLLWVFGL